MSGVQAPVEVGLVHLCYLWWFLKSLLCAVVQATEPASLIPLLRGCESAVLVGDQCQLPPTVVSRVVSIFSPPYNPCQMCMA